MKIFAETDKLILRELVASDAGSMFELDSSPEVHRYLGNNPIKAQSEALAIIQMIRQQYHDHGIGRWAVIEKLSGAFVGWAGLKMNTSFMNGHVNYVDVGYRFIPRFWGRGYATAAASIALQYGFEKMNLRVIYAAAHIDNIASNKVLQKCGLAYVNDFYYHDDICHWYQILREDWLQLNLQELNMK